MRAIDSIPLWLLAAAASGQCGLQLVPGSGFPGVDGTVNALADWDPDGAGPLTPRYVVAGSFRVAGPIYSENAASFDPATREWTPLSWLGGEVHAVATDASGRLAIAGEGGTVSTWSGASWQTIGHFDQVVTDLTFLANGDLVVAGPYQHVDSQTLWGLARWDGAAWHALGAPTTPWSNGTGRSLATMPNGDLLVTGFFTQIGGVTANKIARWDGNTWYAMDSGVHPVNGTPGDIILDSTGAPVASGLFVLPGGGTTGIARWNGTTWAALAPGTAPQIHQIAALPNGSIVTFDTSGLWQSTTSGWQPVTAWQSPLPIPELHAILPTATGILVGGSFTQTPSSGARGVAEWDGVTWRSLTVETNATLQAIAVFDDDAFVASGPFTSIGGVSAQHLATFHGVGWTPLGSGSFGVITSMAARGHDEVLLFGQFGAGAGPTMQSFGNGGFQQVGAPGTWGTNDVVAMATARNGDTVIAHGGPTPMTIDRWNGSSLTRQTLAIAGQPILGQPATIVELANGDLVLGGTFLATSSSQTDFIGRWDGTTWHTLGGGTNAPVLSIAALGNGDIVAVGNFTAPALHVARWNGTTWSQVGAGLPDLPSQVLALPSDDLLVSTANGGSGPGSNRVAHWNGATWQTEATLDGPISGMAMARNGTIALAGQFTTVDDQASMGFARLLPTCPAGLLLSAQIGCTGSAGPIYTLADRLAWIGSEMRATTYRIVPGSLAISLLGLGYQNVPMPNLHPLGQPGCTLNNTADLLLRFDVTNGDLSTDLPIPNVAALVGATFYFQVVPVEVATNGDISSILSSSLLGLTIGAL